MLKELSIKNFILVEFQDLFFQPGLNVITGETGTGKSLILDALSLILGARAREEIVRKNQPGALVEALFSYQAGSPVDQWLTAQGLLGELGQEVVLSREISREGKNRARINGRTVTLADLRALGSLLVDIYGQGEHENFFIPSRQLALLDSFLDGEGRARKEEYRNLYRQFTALQKELEGLRREQPGNIDEVRFSLQEMKDLGLTPEELLEIDQAFRRAADTQEYREALDTFITLCEGGEDEPGILPVLARARYALESVSGDGPDQVFSRLTETVRTIEIELREVLFEAGRAQEECGQGPVDLASLETMVAEIERIKRKHRIRTTEEFIALQTQCAEQISQAETAAQRMAELEQKAHSLTEVLHSTGTRLTEARRQAAGQMKQVLEDELRQLAFSRVEFEVRLDRPEAGERTIRPEGLDDPEFTISLNPGEPPGPIRQVASGGEISRIILGLKTITLEQSGVSTMIFDEIDQGIGGQTAFWVGEKLNRLSSEYQVLCITHLPQIACFADHHTRVDKKFDQDTTWAEVTPLQDQSARIQELARMMGGKHSETPALQYAETLLKRSGKGKYSREG